MKSLRTFEGAATDPIPSVSPEIILDSPSLFPYTLQVSSDVWNDGMDDIKTWNWGISSRYNINLQIQYHNLKILFWGYDISIGIFYNKYTKFM